MAVNSGGDLSIISSDLNATQGDVNLKGSNINLLAAHERTDQSGQELSTGGGIVWTASLDKVGSGLEFVRQNNEDTSVLSTAKVSKVTATGNVQVSADSSLTPGGGLKFDIQPKHSESSDSHLATFRGQGRVQLTGATVSGDLLKGQGGERQSLQAGIDQPIN